MSEIELGDYVTCRSGLISGCGYYDQAVVVSLEPFVLISEQGDMRWSTKNIKDCVAVGKAPPGVWEVCVDRLRRDEAAE